MEDSCEELEERETSKSRTSWILNTGLSLGKKLVVTGFVISSAPIVIPPLVVISALGFAVSVPYGLVFASYAGTEKLMRKLLPSPEMEYEAIWPQEEILVVTDDKSSLGDFIRQEEELQSPPEMEYEAIWPQEESLAVGDDNDKTSLRDFIREEEEKKEISASELRNDENEEDSNVATVNGREGVLKETEGKMRQTESKETKRRSKKRILKALKLSGKRKEAKEDEKKEKLKLKDEKLLEESSNVDSEEVQDQKSEQSVQYSGQLNEEGSPEEAMKGGETTETAIASGGADDDEHSVEVANLSDVPISKYGEENTAAAVGDGLHSNQVRDEEIWKKIDAMRVIIGVKAPPHPSYFDELRTLYLLVGIEPPSSSMDSSDLSEFNYMLNSLMLVIGLK